MSEDLRCKLDEFADEEGPETPACADLGEITVDGQPLFMRCTLPHEHGRWHEHADAAGTVLFFWSEGLAADPDCPYADVRQMLTGPYQTEWLGRYEPEPTGSRRD